MSVRQIETPQGIKKYLPVLQWLPGYSSKWLRSDLVAGLTTAAVLIPQSMAYATIAGLPVEMGLYTPMVLMVVYAILGTSRVLAVSATSTISLLTAASLAPVIQSGDPNSYLTATATLSLLVGVFLILAGVLRLGLLSNLISQPVLTGFKAGVGVVIFVGQLAKVLGVSIEKAPFLQTVVALIQSLDAIHWATFSVALVTLVIMIFLPRLTRRVPAALVAVLLGISASALLGLEARGVALVGDVPSGFPSLTLPDLALVSQLWPGALGIALMAFIESIAAGRTFTQKGDPPINANQELVALGVANITGSFFQAYSGGGSTSRTAMNRRSGAMTQLSSIVISITIALTLLLLASFISLMPKATLGAMVLVVGAGLISLKDFQAIRRIRGTEFIWAIIAFLGVVLLGTLEGILLAVLISILTLFIQASFPPVYAMGRKPGTNVFRPLSQAHPNDQIYPGLLIIRTEGRMNFASAPNTTDKLWTLIHESDPRVVVIEFSAIPDLEYTALNMLAEFDEQLNTQGITLWLATLNPEPLKVIRLALRESAMGDERLFFNLEQAIETYQAMNEDASLE
jgi:high affinity sulfate transporter 1